GGGADCFWKYCI
nr:urotensin IIgamma [Cyprinus carpio]